MLYFIAAVLAPPFRGDVFAGRTVGLPLFVYCCSWCLN